MPTTKNGNCTVWYEVTGDGPPVVMVYGIGGNSRGWWDEFPALLRKRYRLVMLDNRGTGHSDKPEDPWTMTDMTGDIQAVVEAAGLDTFHLLGCSLGTSLARHYVRERGGRALRSLSLLCPPNGISATEEDMQAALWWDRTKAPLENARKSWPIIHPESWIAQNEPELIRRFEAGLVEPTPPRTFKYQMEATQQAGDANATLNEYAWPVLIAHGTRDRLVPPQNAHMLKQAVPRARLEMLEGDSHNFWSHSPERAARVVMDFLDQAEALQGAK
ncbi:MAG TPA: alpha/beta hydrolase [Tepidiformaceae bacterium]|nr:alpha/beta hydrolase [Tepidiformaceae bacterium]